MFIKKFHGFVTKTAACRCGLVDQERLHGNLHMRHCNEKHLKNILENRVNDEFLMMNEMKKKKCEFCVS